MHYIAPFQSPIVFVLSALAGGCFAVMKYTKSFFLMFVRNFFMLNIEPRFAFIFLPLIQFMVMWGAEAYLSCYRAGAGVHHGQDTSLSQE